MAAECKHCHLGIRDVGNGYVHTEGPQQGKHTCALDPYGYHAEPVGTPCGTYPVNPCNGAREGM